MTTNFLFAAYEAQFDAMRRIEAEVLPLNKAALFDALVAAGIHTVVVTFDGSGDSGQIEAIDGFAAENVLSELPAAQIDYREVNFDGPTIKVGQQTVRGVVETMAYNLLQRAHGGWENDDGGYGEFTFSVDDRTISLDFNERFTDSTFYSHQF